MTSDAVSQVARQPSLHQRPYFSGMSHLSVPCRDLGESKVFYSEVMGERCTWDIRIRRVLRRRHHDGLSEQPEGWTGPEDEYTLCIISTEPHFDLIKEWRDSFGMPNYPWRRDNTR